MGDVSFLRKNEKEQWIITAISYLEKSSKQGKDKNLFL